MTTRPKLADAMRQAVQLEPAPTAGFHAATRVGKKKVTVTLEPATHKKLKALAVEREVTIEALLNKAVETLLAEG